MAGLIPLMLKPATASPRSSLALSSSSLSSPERPMSMSNMPTTHTKPQGARSDVRLSHQSPLPLPFLPYTPPEWTQTMAEVKRHFLNKRYRQCSVRCTEILDNMKNAASVEPAYLIFLHFYAATSLEMSVRPLQSSSPYRAKLLQQVRQHYNQADELARIEDDSLTRTSRRSSADSTSMQSSTGSVASRAPTLSTGISSPTPSLYSLDENSRRISQTAPAKKRVTFSDQPPEPIIRPDSPTLGFDDWMSPRGLPLPASPREEEVSFAPTEPEDVEQAADGMDELFRRETSLDRYASVLSGLRAQIQAHISSVDAQMNPPAAAISEVAKDKEEMRSLELQTRIERLRKNGWQRKRFDAKRYEALRESVMAELC